MKLIFNKQGQLIKEIFYYGHSTNIHLMREYNEQVNLIKQTFYRENGDIGSIHEYDDNENIIKAVIYRDKNIIRCIRDVDKKGNIIKETFYLLGGKTINYIIDEKGKYYINENERNI